MYLDSPPMHLISYTITYQYKMSNWSLKSVKKINIIIILFLSSLCCIKIKDVWINDNNDSGNADTR